MRPIVGWFTVQYEAREMGTDYLDVYSVWILPFPRTVYHSDLHEITSVRIEMSPRCTISGNPPYVQEVSHDKIYVEEVIEKPALLDHRIAKDTPQTDAVNIAQSGELLDEIELYWRLNIGPRVEFLCPFGWLEIFVAVVGGHYGRCCSIDDS